jgi:hypothetical protein
VLRSLEKLRAHAEVDMPDVLWQTAEGGIKHLRKVAGQNDSFA